MQITFYRIAEEKRKLSKNVSNGISLNGKLVEDTSIVNPTIRVSFNSNLSVCNYCYIQAFGRYYYIKDIVLSNTEMIITLHCDVLNSFKNDILVSNATITRTNVGNKYLQDNMVKQTSKINRQVKKIGTGFTKAEKYILQIGG